MNITNKSRRKGQGVIEYGFLVGLIAIILLSLWVFIEPKMESGKAKRPPETLTTQTKVK